MTHANKWIICAPGDKYSNTTLFEAATSYTSMSIADYDSMILFSEKYDSFKEIPDGHMAIDQKQAEDLYATLFYNQEMVKVGQSLCDVLSSSVLLGPEAEELEPALRNKEKHGELYLPDLDLISVSGGRGSVQAVTEISKFYRRNGWKIKVIDSPIYGTQTSFDVINPDRKLAAQNGTIRVPSVEEMRSIAAEHLGYDQERFCFRFG